MRSLRLRDVVVGRDEENEAGIVLKNPRPVAAEAIWSVAARFASGSRYDA